MTDMPSWASNGFTVIEWLDPTDRDDGWKPISEAKDACTTAVTMGVILHEDDDVITVGYTTSYDDHYVGKGTINKGAIIRRRDYKYPWKRPYRKPKSKVCTTPKPTRDAAPGRDVQRDVGANVGEDAGEDRGLSPRAERARCLTLRNAPGAEK